MVSTPYPAEAAVVASGYTFRDLVQLFSEHREGTLHAHLCNSVHLVRLEPGVLEIRPKDRAPRDLVNRLGPLLSEWTGRRWTVAANFEAPGEPTLAEQDAETREAERRAAEAHPVVRAVLETFPGSRMGDVHDLTPKATSPMNTGHVDTDSDLAPESDDDTHDDLHDNEGDLDL